MQEETIKRTAQRYQNDEDDVRGQLQKCNQRTAQQDQEIEYLREQIRRLQEERNSIALQYEQKLASMKGYETLKFELERRIKISESETASLEEEVKRLRMRNSSLENEIEELKRQNRNTGDVNVRIEELINEVSYYENQVKQAKTIQINLEQELRQRADERAKMISEYELKITNLQNDLAFLRTKREGDNMRQSQHFNKFQEENEALSTEVRTLRVTRRELEIQIEKLRSEKLNGQDEIRTRLLEVENLNRSYQNIIEQLKARIEGTDLEKVLLKVEIERLLQGMN